MKFRYIGLAGLMSAMLAMLALPAMAQTTQATPTTPQTTVPSNPAPGKSAMPTKSTGGTSNKAVAGSTMTPPININTASAAELDKLPGIGKSRANAIIKHRPYTSVEELHTKKVIPSNVYNKIKGDITTSS